MTTPVRIKAWMAAALMLLLSTSAFAHSGVEAEKERMMNTLDTLRELYENNYAPMHWKEEFFGWSFAEEVAKAKRVIREVPEGVPMRMQNYHKLVLDVINSMRDYHVGIYFWATESAFLPFEVRGADGRYFIVYIDRARASTTAFPFEVGDEIVSFGGRPVDEVVQELRAEATGGAAPLTDQALAEIFLTQRAAYRGVSVPRGPVTIGVRNQDCKVRYVQMIWSHFEEQVRSRGGDWMAPLRLGASMKDVLQQPAPNQPLGEELIHNHPLLGMQMVTPISQELRKKICDDSSAQWDDDEEDEPNRFELGARTSFLPRLSDTVFWESDRFSPFDAYAYTNDEGRRIGVVRIPHYSGYAPEWDAEEFASMLEDLQERTEFLVIDQLNNPGGYVLYLYALASMLSDQPLATPRHRLMLNQETVFQTKRLLMWLQLAQTEEEAEWLFGHSLLGYPVTLQLVRFCEEYCRFIIREWEDGRYLTEPMWMFCVDHINPHPQVQYTHPILVLINELDFSGGDFFPCIMQDNDRATIMGTRTAGAGGAVGWMEFPNRQGIIGMTATMTLAERCNEERDPLENLGVVPDIEYVLTPEDYQHGFEDYAEAVRTVIGDLIPPRGGGGLDAEDCEDGADMDEEGSHDGLPAMGMDSDADEVRRVKKAA